MNAAFAHHSRQSEFEDSFEIRTSMSGALTNTFPFIGTTRDEWSKRSRRSADTSCRGALPLAVGKGAPLSRRRFYELLGVHAGMRGLCQRVEAAAATEGNLLIFGDSGTGKELIARAIHECGPRRDGPFVGLNCAALPKDLIESELFGYKRGAFTGATTEHVGLICAAEGGTLFLDEITEMSADLQSKLLRAIQEGAIRPIGSTCEEQVDVRVIAAISQKAEPSVANEHLREDLFCGLELCALRLLPLPAQLPTIA